MRCEDAPHWDHVDGVLERRCPRRAAAIGIMLIGASVVTACGGAASKAPPTPNGPPTSGGSATPSPVTPVSVPDFRLVAYQGDQLLGGHETKFSAVFSQSQPVVLNFFAGQCPPCQGEMPTFQRVASEYQDKVIFVGVDVGPFTGLGSHDDARKLLSQVGVQYPAAYAVDASPLKLYNVLSMPSTIFFTARGRVAQRASGALFEQQLRGYLQLLVAAPA